MGSVHAPVTITFGFMDQSQMRDACIEFKYLRILVEFGANRVSHYSKLYRFPIRTNLCCIMRANPFTRPDVPARGYDHTAPSRD